MSSTPHLDKPIVKEDPLRPDAPRSELPDQVHLFFQGIGFGRWEEEEEEESDEGEESEEESDEDEAAEVQ